MPETVQLGNDPPKEQTVLDVKRALVGPPRDPERFGILHVGEGEQDETDDRYR